MSRTEFLTPGDCEPLGELAPGVVVRALVGAAKGALNLTTGTATIAPSAVIPYHTHPTCEAIIVLSGEADIQVQARCYRLTQYDAINVPAEVAHAVRNPSTGQPAVLLTSFPTGAPEREFLEDTFDKVSRNESSADDPEHLVRFREAPRYQAGEGIEAVDLFAGRFGARGICGGHARFAPGAAMPCHVHDYDESITIVGGKSVCRVAGQEYLLTSLETVCVPQDRPHRFLNLENETMEMIWVYAGDEPARRVVDAQRCCTTKTADEH